jgi:hypothetical protein
MAKVRGRVTGACRDARKIYSLLGRTEKVKNKCNDDEKTHDHPLLLAHAQETHEGIVEKKNSCLS